MYGIGSHYYRMIGSSFIEWLRIHLFNLTIERKIFIAYYGINGAKFLLDQGLFSWCHWNPILGLIILLPSVLKSEFIHHRLCSFVHEAIHLWLPGPGTQPGSLMCEVSTILDLLCNSDVRNYWFNAWLLVRKQQKRPRL